MPAAQAAGALAETPSAQAEVEEGRRALVEAKKTGRRVEVQEGRSERTTMYANPDGFTFTLEESAVPVRVAKPGGGWQAPDATLERRTDGSVGPKAASAAMTFSGGGKEKPLVALTRNGRSLKLSWPGRLPVPELDGPSAVYREVLPDVDLKVTATVESFQEVLVVKTPKAAANPALKRLTFGLETEGLSVRRGAAGNFDAVDGNGNTVFQAPPAQMWDSAGKTTETQLTKQPRQNALLADGKNQAAPRTGQEDAPNTRRDTSETAASGTGLAPGQGDNVHHVDVKVTDDSLSVVPNTGMLAGTEAGHFPLFIDPTVGWGAATRTALRSDDHASYGWGNGADNLGMGMGKCGSWGGAYCGPGYVQRLYFQFTPDALKGKRVLDATFRVTEPWAFQCDPRVVQLVRTDNFSSSTRWPTRPTERDWLTEANVSAGRGSACDPNSPAAPIEFHDNPNQGWQNLTPTVRDFAAGKFSRLSFELRAKDESDPSAWKRFRNDATLAVTYVAYPAKPTNVGIVTGTAPVCSTNASAPTIISDPRPTLTATPQTAAGSEAGARLHAWFRIETQAAGGTWSGSGISSPTGTNFIGDNVKATAKWGTPLAEGSLHRYASLTQVFHDNSSYSQSSGYTSWCYFKVDPTAPKQPTIAFKGPYVECASADDCPAAGAPGVTGTFGFGPATGDTNKAYEYRLTGDTWRTATGATATGSVTPPNKGTYTLEVRAVDTLGRPGEPRTVQFKVSDGAAPVGRWNFTEEDGPALDSAPDGGAADAPLTGGVTRDDRGRRGLVTHDQNGVPLGSPVTDKGLSFSGVNGYASTAGPAVQTGSAYTVSAWVRLEDGSANYTALAQDPVMSGGWYSAFYLGYRADSKTWELRTSPKEGPDGDISNQIVRAKQPAALGVWTHLAAVYDNATKQIDLYVNGESQGPRAVAPSWTSTGRLQMGRAWWRGAYYDYWKGSIDEVAVWQRALKAGEIADEARALLPGGWQAAELVAEWSADGANGNSVSDVASGYGRTLTLEGGAQAIADGFDLSATGPNGAATAPGPLVDDQGSFTVSTAVALDGLGILQKGEGYVGQVVGQRTANGSSWGLWFKVTGTKVISLDPDDPEPAPDRSKTVPVGFWQFGRLNADGTFDAVESTEEAILDATVRLTGVFDAQDKTISLRVGGALQGDKEFTAVVGSGEFAVGKGMTGGTWKYFLPAHVTDVRVWTGAMKHEDQIETQVGS
ncbi:LamG domain-containing protein [Streptomyces roseicoloratus]|uniref:LamG domain-containing protein n=1 Tax=Streptomyces roseicoloratus TaxID=2508722 RepID=A0ABY9RZ57_9ACTN|nr:LamG domain-containing protein [Streptomyces roseicoloratus]WMX47315.1 LamG domain-containing protein [Streptomyces roseicoloratus]